MKKKTTKIIAYIMILALAGAYSEPAGALSMDFWKQKKHLASQNTIYDDFATSQGAFASPEQVVEDESAVESEFSDDSQVAKKTFSQKYRDKVSEFKANYKAKRAQSAAENEQKKLKKAELKAENEQKKLEKAEIKAQNEAQKAEKQELQMEAKAAKKALKPEKPKKQSFLQKFKAKRQAKKNEDITVTAKTDKNQPSVLIQTKDDDDSSKSKSKKKAEKQEQTVLEKTFAPKTEDSVHEVSNKEQSAFEDLPENVFNASASVEGSVATNTIISVDDCVKIALENNPLIISQMMSKDLYKNKVAQAWSNYFPTLNAGVSYSRNDMLMTNFKFPMQKYNLFNVPTIGFNQLIYDFGKTGAQAAVAKKTYEASKENLQASINDIVYQVKSAYYNLLYLQNQVEVYEDSVLQYQIHLKQAEAYYEIGGKAKIDVTTAQYNLDNTKLTLITAKNAVDEGFAQLTNSMGTPEIPAFSIKDRLDRKKYEVKFEDALQTAYEARPELMAAKKKMEGSKLLIKSSKTAFLPNIQGFGSYNHGGSHVDTDYGYQIGAQLAYSNLNLYLLKKQVDEARLTYKKDQADYEVQRQKVYLDVKQAFIQLRNAQQSIPVARSNMNVAKERYDLASGRYKAGLGDAIELKDAQNTYMNAQLQYYNTLMQYHISAANLERVIGSPLSASDENL